MRTDEPRAPRQGRSQKRVDQILATARELIAEKGCANLAMTEIAARAGITAGSMYQYFTNRSAIVAALAEGYLTAFSDHLVATLEEAARQNGTAAVGGLIGELLQSYETLHRTDPVARDVLTGFAADKTLQALDARLTDALLERIVRVFLAATPSLDQVALRLQIRLLLQYADAAVRVALDQPDSDRQAILNLAGRNLADLWRAFAETLKDAGARSGPA